MNRSPDHGRARCWPARLLQRLALLATVSLAVLGPGIAQAGGAKAQLQAFIKATDSATGQFEQLAGAAGERSTGRFAFARPGKFRWEIVQPYPQLMVADGKQVYFHDVDLNQVTVRPMDGALGATPAAILSGTGGIDENFTVSELPDADGLQWLEAVPRQKEAGFERIRMGFANQAPVQMEVLDAFNRTSVFRFHDLVANPPADPSRFAFTIPAGADVVRP
ncbi:MAG: outer membrane lipoprotein carrier protein LolA [Burkholderiaceae bacterium]